jgi:membrane dipeptidase
VYGTWPWRYPVNSLEEQQALLLALQQRGMAERDVQAIARDNFLRVFQAVLR